MKTLPDVVRFIKQYNVGGRSAKCLRAALLKRIELDDPTDELIRQLTFSTTQDLLKLYGSVEGIRKRLDDAVAFMRYMELPFANTVFAFVNQLDWDRIAEAFDELKPIETLPESAFMTPSRKVQTQIERIKDHAPSKLETDLKVKDDQGVNL